MSLDYYPLGINKINNFFEEIGYTNKSKQLETVLNNIDDRFCKYKYENNTICFRKTRNPIAENCCIQHLKYLYPELYKDYKKKYQKNYYKKKDKKDINYCISRSRRNEVCHTKVKNSGDLCKKHIHKKEKYFYFGNIEIDKDLEENKKLKMYDNGISNKDFKNKSFSKSNEMLEDKILFGENIIDKINNDINNIKPNPLVFDKLSRDELNYCFKNGIKIYTEIKSSINLYDLNNKKINVQKFLNIYEKNKKINEYIKNNKKYLFLLNNNKSKNWYYKEEDIKNFFESINIRFKILLDDIRDYEKNDYDYFLKEYEEDINKYILEFYEIDSKYKIYI